VGGQVRTLFLIAFKSLAEIESTVRYLGIEVDDALAIAETD
jgi:hypothetical protein